MAETDAASSIALSEAAFARARKVMPGGVSSPVRAWGAVGGTPRFLKEGEGCRVTDLDGREYIDYIASYGPLIAGHANDRILTAISKAAGRGTTFGCPTTCETKLAETIAGAFDSIEMTRFVSSGTEAVMSALRLARAATGRPKVVKCIGCYHGNVNALLAESSGEDGDSVVPSSPGVTEAMVANTLLVPYNDLESARRMFEKHPENIACFIVEPIAANMGLVKPKDGYLQGLRELCDEFGAMLVFDEMITGFRVAWGGAQTLLGVTPDLTCLGRIIGGGLPVGAYGGRRELMEQVSPTGPVYQAGTLSGNPVVMMAGLATLEILADQGEPGPYEILEAAAGSLEAGLREAAGDAGVPLTINRAGSMIGLYLTESTDTPVDNFDAVLAASGERFATLFHAMLDRGVMLAPSRFEAMFIGLAHTADDVEHTLEAAREAFKVVAEQLD